MSLFRTTIVEGVEYVEASTANELVKQFERLNQSIGEGLHQPPMVEDVVDEAMRNFARIAALEDERDRLRHALDDLLHLCMHASKDAFCNGVTDCSGTIDEGGVRAGAIIDKAREALQPEDQS